MNAKKQPQIRDGFLAVINEMNWLRGQDLLKTLQSAFGYEVATQKKQTLTSSDQSLQLRIDSQINPLKLSKFIPGSC